jgi:hypothetical protein
MITLDFKWINGPAVVDKGATSCRGASEAGVIGKTPILLFRSRSRISRVASIPSLTGSWISIFSLARVREGARRAYED